MTFYLVQYITAGKQESRGEQRKFINANKHKNNIYKTIEIRYRRGYNLGKNWKEP